MKERIQVFLGLLAMTWPLWLLIIVKKIEALLQ